MTQRLDLLASLTTAGKLRPAALEAAMRDPRFAGMPLARSLVESGLVDEVELARFMAELYDVPFLRVAPSSVRPEALGLVPRAVAENFAMIPLRLDGDLLTLAMADPFDVTAEDVVSLHTHHQLRKVVAPRSDILDTLSNHSVCMAGAIEGMVERYAGQEVEFFSISEEAEEVPGEEAYGENDQPIINLVNGIMVEAVAMRASDVHLEPMEEFLRVRYRIDGLLRNISKLPKPIQNAVVSRLKLASGMDISERRRPQDGRSRVRVGGRWIDLRVSSLPGYHGEKLVLRILDQDVGLVQLESLGMLPEDHQVFRQVLDSPQGTILITGPTGSGKTTTLYASLNLLNRPTCNIVTVEDPIEYHLHGITQVQVNPRAGVTFASALRSILRQDPDIVLVGEIRDAETAEIAFQAAQTGHLVFSTLHTNSCASTVTRLQHMQVTPFLVASSLLLVVAQRLVRRLCQHCRREVEPAPELVRRVGASLKGHPLPEVFYDKGGCDDCGMTGYQGRLGLFELLPMGERMRSLLYAGAGLDEVNRLAAEDGVRTLLSDGLEKVRRGLTSLAEVLRVVSLDAPPSSGQARGEVTPPLPADQRPRTGLLDGPAGRPGPGRDRVGSPAA